MKSRGIVRDVDELGRFVLPVEIRRLLEMNDGDTVEIYFDDESEQIMLKKYREQACLFCSSGEQQLIYFKKHLVCRSCINNITSASSVENPDHIQQPIHTEPVQMHHPARPAVRRKDTAARLVKAMQENPSASQRDLAAMLGVSQSRVSQLLRTL